VLKPYPTAHGQRCVALLVATYPRDAECLRDHQTDAGCLRGLRQNVQNSRLTGSVS
jgi:hypothetical protein